MSAKKPRVAKRQCAVKKLRCRASHHQGQQHQCHKIFVAVIVILGLVVVGLFLLLALPIRAIGGHAIAGSAPVAGQVYVVQSGDTLSSIAHQVAPGQAGRLVARLAAEAGSSTIVPGEHLLIP